MEMLSLSCVPLSDTVAEVPVAGETVLLMDRLEALLVFADNIADWTALDPVLQQVLRKLQHGWGDKCPDPGLQPCYIRRDKIKHPQWMYFCGGTMWSYQLGGSNSF